MTWRRASLFTVACLLPVVVGLTYLGTTRVRLYTKSDTGIVRLLADFSYKDDYAGTDIDGLAFFCTTQGGLVCGDNPCGYCHTSPDAKAVYTSARHRDVYFRRAAITSAGQVPLGESGYLDSRSGQMKFYLNDGTLSLTAPIGSLPLKDRSGKPFLYMPGEPTIHPTSR